MFLSKCVCLFLCLTVNGIATEFVGVKRQKSDPIVNLTFDGDVENGIYSGGQYNFTAIGQPALDTGVSGNGIRLKNQGMRVEDAAQCLDLAEAPEDICPFNTTKCTQGITVAFWLKIDSIPECSNFYMLGNKEGLFLEDIRGGTWSGIMSGKLVAGDSLFQPNGKWVFWTLVYLGSLADPEVYINGDLQEITIFTPIFYSDKPGLTIGCRPSYEIPDSYNCGLNGTIDEFEVYTTALPVQVIKEMYI